MTLGFPFRAQKALCGELNSSLSLPIVSTVGDRDSTIFPMQHGTTHQHLILSRCLLKNWPGNMWRSGCSISASGHALKNQERFRLIKHPPPSPGPTPMAPSSLHAAPEAGIAGEKTHRRPKFNTDSNTFFGYFCWRNTMKWSPSCQTGLCGCCLHVRRAGDQHR